MGFAVGETVGQFEIVEYIGQGGMATIYKAHQTNLDRFVALKVIHPVLKDDQAFLNRLKREASIIAKLNHPNIVTVYDFSEFEGIPFLVLRFIDGKTLKAVLQQQRLGTTQILKIIRPVADALSYAHSRGVLHRDVKPSNILIDNEGHVYLTDFGLARIAHSSESTSSHDMMIGSPHYLSPEQAKSESSDARTDIYSLGIVLFEMFTGQVPFSADTPYGTILAQINQAPPSPRSINPKVPPAVEQVILKALAKDPKDRYASVRDMMRALENAARGPKNAPEEDAAPIPLVDYKPARTLPLPDSLTDVGKQIKTAAVSLSNTTANKRPSWVFLVGALVTLTIIFLCLLGATLLAIRFPSFQAGGTTFKTGTQTVSIAGIVATPRIPAGSATETSAPASPPAIIEVTATPAPPTPTRGVTASPPSTSSTRPPAPAAADAPKGKIVYSVATGDQAEQHSIWVANADGSNAHKVIDLAMWPSLSPDGKLIAYYRIKDEGIYVANIDGGDPHKILVGETCCVQWSRDSKHLMYVAGKLKSGDTRVKLVNPDGSNVTELTLSAAPYNPAWSPDGNRIAYAACNASDKNVCGIIVYDLSTKESKMITTDGGGAPQWSPRGDKIVYRAGNPNIFVVNPDGTGLKQLTSGKSNDGQPVWSNDGNFVFWRSDQDGKGWAIYVMRADGSDKRLVINNTPPDGDRWGYESLSTGP